MDDIRSSSIVIRTTVAEGFLCAQCLRSVIRSRSMGGLMSPANQISANGTVELIARCRRL